MATLPMTEDESAVRPFWSEDVVTQVRRWGTDTRTTLDPARGQYKAGSSSQCEIWVGDAKRMSREHALFSYEKGRWLLADIGSRNGTRVDDRLTPLMALEPGAVIRMGEATYVAESDRLITLYRFIARLLGWADVEAIDNALQCVRRLIIKGEPLIIAGQENLGSVAALVHRIALGEQVPFFEYRGGKPTSAVTHARGGMLCIARATREATEAFIDLISEQKIDVPRLVLCARTEGATKRIRGSGGALGRISVPLLTSRIEDVPRLISESLAEISRWYSISLDCLTEYDHECMRTVEFTRITELYSELERLVLVRGIGVTRAAMLLGKTHPTLIHWREVWTHQLKSRRSR